MKAAAIIQLITLPAIMAKLTLQIVSQQSGGVKVQGPGKTGGEVLFQDASQFGKAGTTASCLDASLAWTTDCPDQPTYLKVAELNFAKATEGRAFDVITPFEHLSCQIALEDKEGDYNYVWSVDQYFLDPDEPSTDGGSHGLVNGVEVSCMPSAGAP